MGLLKETIQLLDPSWQKILLPESNTPAAERLECFLAREMASDTPIYPPQKHLFAALAHTPLPQIKAVIIGQDPYHGPGQAHGLAFSVPEKQPLPPSLRNIFKERETDLGIKMPKSGSLLAWAKQGVLLLNTVLSVRKQTPQSHFGQGWERFTDCIIAAAASLPTPVAFLLWGKLAQKKRSCIQESPHKKILEAPHPSPLSAFSGFFGSRPFSKTNEFLQGAGQDPIDWS